MKDFSLTKGFYGRGCKSQCNCPDMDYCDPASGYCQCKQGYRGRKCNEPCSNNTYGNGCNKQCKCHVTMLCDHVTGTCFCDKGLFGENCGLVCPHGFYGRNCTQR